jgi:hypothetical protein
MKTYDRELSGTGETVTSEVSMAVNIWIVISVVTLCSLVGAYRRFERDVLLRNVGNHVKHYMASLTKKTILIAKQWSWPTSRYCPPNHRKKLRTAIQIHGQDSR